MIQATSGWEQGAQWLWGVDVRRWSCYSNNLPGCLLSPRIHVLYSYRIYGSPIFSLPRWHSIDLRICALPTSASDGPGGAARLQLRRSGFSSFRELRLEKTPPKTSNQTSLAGWEHGDCSSRACFKSGGREGCVAVDGPSSSEVRPCPGSGLLLGVSHGVRWWW